MSHQTVSQKRNRVYERAFDHDEAIALREADPKTWTYAALAAHFGVSYEAVRRVVNPRVREAQARKGRDYQRARRQPCRGDCGNLVWCVNAGRSGYCPTCLGVLRVAEDVRDDELRCREKQWDRDRHRQEKPVSMFKVIRRNGDGWVDFAEIEANSGLAAVEKAATEPGTYVAISLKQICVVEPVTSLRVVRGP